MTKSKKLRLEKLQRADEAHIKKQPLSSRERPDAASSSSALAAPSGMSVAAKHGSKQQTEGLAGGVFSFGTVNDKDPCDGPNSTGHSNEARKLSREGVEAVLSSNGVVVGEIKCSYRDVCSRSSGEPAKLPRMIEDDEIKSEGAGSGRGYRKEEHDHLKKKYDDLEEENDHLKKKNEVFEDRVILRQIFSAFEKTEECKVMSSEHTKETLKLLEEEEEEGKNTIFKEVVRWTPFTKLLRTMFTQKFNKPLKESFDDLDCYKPYFSPKISNPDENLWWIENFEPEILDGRLKILEEAGKNWKLKKNSKRDIFLVVQIVTGLNSEVHPQINEKDPVDLFTLATKIDSRRSGGDSKI